MRAGAYLSGLSRKMIELGYNDVLEIIGVAAGLIDPDKELSSKQMEEIANSFSGLDADENDKVELGIGLAELIRHV